MPLMFDPTEVPESTLEPIAVCGMACRLPGQIDSPSKLWELLLAKGSAQTPRVPASRFNIDAHYHPDLNRPGSFNVMGGYFLDGPADAFDPTFFNMMPIEAMWLDPQQRRILEVCYEAFESAGLTLEDVSGTNTAVYAATFTADYQQMSHREMDFRHNYVATGVDTGILSNRVGNTFNLNGPSFTINTACSSSIYAVHNACHALRARDCEAALVAGVNLILTVDQHMNTAKLGILSPTSTCHTFDASADGYGRAEGAGALYLKRLSDALRDGDVIRTVIRSTAVNTNGKVPGMGITHPSKKGQERVVRQAYEKAALNPNDTAYFECHGTGTPVGDPIEVHAVSKAMNDTRSPEKPLILSAIKANIGHSEAASGIFAIIKAAMMTEYGMIPGTSEKQELGQTASSQNESACLPLVYYGGTNGHVIVEDVQALHPYYRHGKPKELADYDHSATRPFLVVQSAHDQNTLTKNIAAHQSVVDKYYVADFAHTMNTKRTRLGHRAYTVVTQGSETSDMDPTAFQSGVVRKSIPDLAFIFTGQGAAWAGVAVEALEHFPIFAASIRNLDEVLRTIEHPADFSIYEELLASPENSRINHPKYSQPILVAIELALVDLFASWDIVPKATVGHSAGEYAAAYAAGLASAPEIIIAAYYRGYCLDRYAPSGGSMLAVGVGADEVSELLSNIGTELVIACENSPKSVTLSGPVEAIKAAKATLDEASVFARELATGMAYHSPAMNPVAKPMVELVTSAWQKIDSTWLNWRRPRCTMFSSVDNTLLKMGQITPSYWAQNLTGRVRFPQAVAALAKHPKNDKLKVFVELGPHSALAGPLKQILEAEQIKGAVHVPSFVRKQNSAVRLLKTAGQLFIENYPVDLAQVNEVTLPFSSQKRMVPLTLVDLPSYQWQYEKQYWAENRTSAQHRAITHARHDVLGRRIPGLTKSSFVWSNRLRNKDLPWLQDHKLGGDIMFPAAGHMAAAIEATRQLCELRAIDIKGVQLRDIDISNALVIPNDEDGIQIQVRLTEVSVGADSLPSFQFVLESIVDDVEKTHSTGKVVPLLEERADESYEAHPVDLSKLTRRQSGNRWYEALREVGFDYGPSFNDLQSVRSSGKGRDAAASLHVRQSNPVMQDESRYMLHPSTVDACLQLIIISIHRGMAENLPWGVVPVKIEQASFWPLDADNSSLGQAVAWTSEQDGRFFNTHTKLKSSTGKLVLDITGLQCIMYEAAIPVQKTVMPEQQPYSMSKWDIDVDASVFADIPWTTSGQNALMDLVKLINHKASPATAAIVGSVEDDVVSAVKDAIPNVSNVTLYRPDVSRESEPIHTDGTTKPESSGYKNLIESQSQPYNLVIADLTDLTYYDTVSKDVLSYVTNMVEETGRIAGLITAELLQATKETFDSTKLTLKTKSLEDLVLFYATPVALTTAPAALTLFCASNADASSNELVEELRKHDITVEVTALSKYSASYNHHAVIYDPAGTILTMLDEQSWKGLQDILSSGRLVTWLTKGVNELTSVDGGSAQGFLRVLRAEDPGAKLDLLDIDSASSPLSVSTALKYLASRNFEQTSEVDIADTEFWLHDGNLLCLRVESATKVNSTIALEKQQTSTRRITDAVLIGSLSDTGLTFQKAEPVVLGAGQVEVCVTHEGLSRSDNGPRFVAGTVTRVGQDISEEAKGQHVVVASSQSFTTHIQAAWSECVVCPAKNIATVIEELPMVISAVNALQYVSPDHHIYLLPMESAKQDAFLLAAHAMNLHVEPIESGVPAKRVEAVMQAAGSQRKVAVISQDFENYAQEVWRSIPAGCSFVVNEGPVSSVLDPLPLTRGAVFRSTSMKTLWKSHPQDLNSILRLTVQIIGDSASKDQAVVPHIVNVEQFSSDPKAQASATVLTYGYGQDQVLIKTSPPKATFSPDACYLLVGCLGGLGRSLTTWMIERGARHLAFISRSGSDKPEAAELVESLRADGVTADVYRGDASSLADVQDVVATVSKTRPIRGVVHAAMVLNDGVFGPALSMEQFNSVMAPKVNGAKALVEALRDCALDFFVMTSSISATVGTPGQCAYAAANSFLDSLASKLRMEGVPAVSLALPMILGVGVVAESDTLEQQIRKRGMHGVEEDEMLRGFEAAICRSSDNNLVAPAILNMGLDPVRLAAAVSSADLSNVCWWNDGRLSAVRRAIENLAKDSGSSQAAGTGSVISEVLNLAHDDALALVAQHIIEKCSTILMVPVENFEVEGPSVASYGLDSMIGTEMRSWLFKTFGLKIPFQELLSASLSFAELSKVALAALQA
ncbi:uncharacterized protein ALTATR162_LOCUS9909 [Alternaria atra]|uniref:Polyketide synthase n=1 Tax=Alternaria atra TaxID=119953 RepID=A0A8J2IA99_9PLEO|nr:uncharacterized protein ALTATR162_LOCUS9909 [Alternaria atra]CAG5181935.1 unnamed protein product [Alternaria atra]